MMRIDAEDGAKLVFHQALNKEPASIVIPATSVFPVITVVLAVLF